MAASALKVLVVDDEWPARQRLVDLLVELARTGELPLEVAGEAGDATEALERARARPVDLVLLDIRLPGRGGLALAADLARLPSPPAVVFVTAHAEHAVQAFELDAVDYLTKPVRRDRLQAALQRVAQRRGAAAPAMGAGAPALVVMAQGRIRRVPLAELLYLRAETKLVHVEARGLQLLTDEALTDIEQRLGAGFVRIHRNAIVALHAVRALDRREVGPEGEGWAVLVGDTGEWLPVSRRQLAAVREALQASGLPPDA